MIDHTAKPVKHVLLATHYAPVLHGQAMIAAQLLDVSKQWTDVKIHGLNTAYNEDRKQFKSFAVSKLVKLFGFMRRAKKLIREHSISEVIICPAFFKGPFLKDTVFIWYLKKFCNVKIIGWIHMDPNRINLQNQPSWFRKIASKSLSMYSSFVSVAPSLIEKWPAYIRSSASTLTVTNGIKGISENTDIEKSANTVNVVYLSAMDDEKGWRELLAAAEILCEVDTRYQFDFYGGVGGNLTTERVESAFAKLQNKSRITWHGPVMGEMKALALNKASLFILPSHTEQFSIAILEAMSCGLAVIATDVGGTRDAVPLNRLVSPNNVSELSDKIAEVCSNEDELIKEGQANKEKFTTEFSEDVFSRKWNELLRK